MNTITKAVEQVDGVQDVNIDLKAKTARVTFVANKTTVVKIEQAVVKAGYAANDKKVDAGAYAKLPQCCKVNGGH